MTREEVFITTKTYGGNYERAGGIIDDALADLGVDYIDLLLIHQPGYDDAGVYKAMEEAVRASKLRSIGISNYYTKEQVDEVLSFAEIMPAVIQNENHRCPGRGSGHLRFLDKGALRFSDRLHDDEVSGRRGRSGTG